MEMERFSILWWSFEFEVHPSYPFMLVPCDFWFYGLAFCNKAWMRSACPLCFTCSLRLSTLKFNILWQSLNVKHGRSPLLAPCDFWQCIECTMCLLSSPFSFATFLVEHSWVSNFEHLNVRCERWKLCLFSSLCNFW
jgi:hypothetical protein